MSNKALPDYSVHIMKPEEYIFVLLLSMGACFLIGLTFYGNIILSLFFAPIGILYLPFYKKEQVRKRKEALHIQFKDALYFISVSLSAGKSIESAIADAHKALCGIYPDRECDIIKELEIMNARIMMNEPVEKAFDDLAQRCGIEDIKSFAGVLMVAKRSGANLMEVIKNTSTTISEKVEMCQEIENIISGKKFEQKILCVMPFALILFLRSTSPDFMEPIMTTVFGHIIMTIALIMIILGLLLSRKITNIEV